jgi:hypothetical protein
MKTKMAAWAALILSIFAVAFEIQQRVRFREEVTRVADERERAYCRNLATYVNRIRAMTGSEQVNPTNYADVLMAFFQTTAGVLDSGVLSATNNSSPPK